MNRVLYVLAVLTTACGFSANFVLGNGPASQGLPIAFVLAFVELAALVAPAVYAYLRPSNLRNVYLAALALFVVGLPFALAPQPSFVANVLRYVLEGLSITLTVSVLSLLPVRSVFSVVSLSFAASMLLVACANLVPGLSPDNAAKILLLLYFAAAGAMLFTAPAESVAFARGRGEGGAAKTPKAITGMLLEQRESLLPVVGLATLLTLVLGMFENHFLASGYEFATSQAPLLISAVIFVGLAALGRVWHPETWFAKLFAGLTLVCVVGLLLMLLVPAALTVLSGYFNSMTVVAMIPMCVYSTELAKRHGLSPIMVAGPLCVPITLGLTAGGLLDAALFALLGTEAYNISNIAAVALATIAGVVIAVFMLAGSRKEPVAAAENTHEASDQLQRDLEAVGLSEREAQIAVLYSQGRSVPYISRELSLAESTIKSHIKHVYVKTGVHNKQDLLDYISHLQG